MASYYDPVVRTNVLEDLKSGMSCAEAARRSKVCVATVYRWRNESKANFGQSPVKRPRAELRAEVMARLAKGSSVTSLAAEYNISTITIHSWNRNTNLAFLSRARHLLEKLNARTDLPEDAHPKLAVAIAVMGRFLGLPA